MLAVWGCAGTPDVVPTKPAPPQRTPPADAQALVDAPPDALGEPEVWLRGSTHVHAKPSGDATLPIDDVIRWYVDHHYDFIVLTDHNRVSIGTSDKLIVIAGAELTNNPQHCEPPG